MCACVSMNNREELRGRWGTGRDATCRTGKGGTGGYIPGEGDEEEQGRLYVHGEAYRLRSSLRLEPWRGMRGKEYNEREKRERERERQPKLEWTEVE